MLSIHLVIVCVAYIGTLLVPMITVLRHEEREEEDMMEHKYVVIDPKGNVGLPYEHIMEAVDEAKKLAVNCPDKEFTVAQICVGITYPSKDFIVKNYR